MNYQDAKKRLMELEPLRVRKATFVNACKRLQKEIKKQERSKKSYKISNKNILGQTTLSDVFGENFIYNNKKGVRR